jgi:N4-(beta-N-acetylglucosaminyl)-L-asparaginase
MIDRRAFIRSAIAGVAASTVAASARRTAAAPPTAPRADAARPINGPVVVSSANGQAAAQRAVEMLRQGVDPVDAVVAGVNLVEADPQDMTVGLGGLPNEDGVVELDSCVMHGPTHKAGAVAALRNIVHASSVALQVMRRTDHVLLVGEGALRFARAHGFPEQDLLTDDARRAWLRWKERLSDQDDWLPGPIDEVVPGREVSLVNGVPLTYGTINCNAVDAQGNLAGVTTTSGLSYKIPGRVGDSPIIGAGLYVDNHVGAAGSTGRGEANIQNCSSFAVVELMRNGLSPEQACLRAVQRIIDRCEPRLKRPDGRPDFDVKFYALAKDGTVGGAAIWSGARMTVHDHRGHRFVDLPYLFKTDD